MAETDTTKCAHSLQLTESEWESLGWLMQILRLMEQGITVPVNEKQKLAAGITQSALIKMRDRCVDSHETIHCLEDTLSEFLDIWEVMYPGPEKRLPC